MNSKRLVVAMTMALILVAFGIGYLQVKVGNLPQAGRARVRAFDFVLQNKAYSPDTVTLKLGDTVVFNIDNRDNESHGLHLPQFGVAEAIPALSQSSVRFTASQTGSLATSCALGHPEKINVIVKG